MSGHSTVCPTSVICALLMTGAAAEKADEPPPTELFEYLAEFIETSDGRLLDPLQLADQVFAPAPVGGAPLGEQR